MTSGSPQPSLLLNETSSIDVLKVAKLARLHVASSEIEETRAKLGAVVSYMDRLRGLDLAGVEPLAHVGEASAASGGLHNRLDEDVVNEETLRGVLPMLTRHLYEDSGQVFVRVPKVIGGDVAGSASGGGA